MVFNADSLYEMEDILYYYNRNIESVTMRKKVFLWNGPELIGKHLETKINMDSFDMKEQLNRVITHQLFLVVKSQFNQNTSYFKIRHEILEQLNKEYYFNAINKCNYSWRNIKGNLAKISLKRKFIFLIYIFSKIY